jgi:hypothetical protein
MASKKGGHEMSQKQATVNGVIAAHRPDAEVVIRAKRRRNVSSTNYASSKQQMPATRLAKLGPCSGVKACTHPI